MPAEIVITEDIIDQALELAAKGLNREQAAAMLGMSRSTFYNKCRDIPEFKAAFRQGRMKAVGTIIAVLFEKAKGGDYSSIQFLLRAFCPEEFSDTRKLIIETPAQIPDYSGMSDAALMEFAMAPMIDNPDHAQENHTHL